MDRCSGGVAFGYGERTLTDLTEEVVAGLAATGIRGLRAGGTDEL